MRGSIEAVGHVDEEVHADEEGAEEDRQPHDQGVVEVLHGDDEVAAEAGYGEDGLDDEGAGEHRGDGRAEDGEDGEERVADLVAPDDLARGGRPLATAVRM